MAAKAPDWRPGPSVCRCCFAEGCYKDISTEYFWMGKREVYSEMLTETFDVTISYSQTGGPNSNSRLICEPCISRLRDASDFKRQVQDCEKMFLQHLAQPTGSLDFDIPEPSVREEVKLERVKLEAKLDNDDFDSNIGFPDDDDDLDDEPLMNLASKVPKEETGEPKNQLRLKEEKKPEKRKSLSKVKSSPAKKIKKKESPKPSASKMEYKTVAEKKKKDYSRHNAKTIVQYTTAYPFRLPEEAMVCVYCDERVDDPTAYRRHMNENHDKFNVATAFYHLSVGYIKVDCTELHCRLCTKELESLESAAKHLMYEHRKFVKLDCEIGLQPFVLHKDKFQCTQCDHKAVTLRAMSRHTQIHYVKVTCESCGKSYTSNSSLSKHVEAAHSGNKACRKCKKVLKTREEKKLHMDESLNCRPYLCIVCGQRFISATTKQKHCEEAHGRPKKNYLCSFCHKVFNRIDALSKHAKIHNR